MSRFTIHDAITLIKTSFGEFSLSFVKVDGSKRVLKKRVRQGVMPSAKKIARLQKKAQEPAEMEKEWNHNLNQEHNLLLFDVEKNRAFKVKIPFIMAFNGIQIDWHVKKKG